jgi:hypothetical protein
MAGTSVHQITLNLNSPKSDLNSSLQSFLIRQ